MAINLLKTTTVYNFDASALIVLSHTYPINRFSPLWEDIEILFEQKRAYVVREAYEEIVAKNDEIAAWLKAKETTAVIDPGEEDYKMASQIIAKHPSLEDEDATKTRADAYVMAHSLQHGTKVVTDERVASSGKNKKKAKIPNVCDEYGIQHISGEEFALKLFEELDLTL